MLGERLFRAKIFNSSSDGQVEFLKDGGLAIDAHGSVAGVGSYSEMATLHPDAHLIDYADRWIVPGFVDAHVHISQAMVMASFGQELLDWLDRYIFPAERDFTPAAANAICPDFFRALLSYGVTTAAIYSNVRADSTHVCFEWAERTGIRAIIGKVMMDRHSPPFLIEDTAQSLRESEELCKTWHGTDNGRLLYALTPRFALSCSAGLMDGVAHLAKQYGAYVQTHISENRAEIARVKELFPEATTYTDVYLRAGLLGPQTVLGHGIHLGHDEWRLLKDSETSLVHCPTSNLFLNSGLMPLREVMDRGLKVGLGSDVGAGPTLSPFEVMRTTVYVHRLRKSLGKTDGSDVTPATAFYLATLGGARALCLDDRIGSLGAGKEADFAVIDPNRLGPVRQSGGDEASPDQLLARLVFLGDDRCVEQTYVRGKLCFSRIEGSLGG